MGVQRHDVGPRMSQVVVHGDTVYTAGQVADDGTADVAEQTRQVLAKIDRLLETAGTGKSNILSATIWLTDIGAFAAMNEIWDAWVVPGQTPARACTEAKLARSDLLVEIAVIAGR